MALQFNALRRLCWLFAKTRCNSLKYTSNQHFQMCLLQANQLQEYIFLGLNNPDFQIQTVFEMINALS